MHPGRILVTAFEPFDGQSVNPSQEVLRLLVSSRVDTLVLPVSYARSVELALRVVERIKPQAVLCLGQAGGCEGITVERSAVNLDEANTPDHDGIRLMGSSIIEDGPEHLPVTLPAEELCAAINMLRIPCRLSDDAGRFVCNHLLYSLLFHAPQVPAGFIHLPWLPEQAAGRENAPSMTLQDMLRAVMAVIRFLEQ